MKVIWFSHFIPYPPKGGAHQRSYNLLRQVSKRHEVHLVAFNLVWESEEKLSESREHLRTFCSSVEFWNLPLRWKGPKWWMRLLLSPWLRHPLSPGAFWSEQTANAWSRILGQHPGALLHFDSSDLALLASRSAGFRKVLNHHNCESAMMLRRAEKSGNPFVRWLLQIQARKLNELEKTACRQFGANLAVSAEDAALLAKVDPGAHYHVVENGTDVDFFKPLGSVEEKNRLMFAGSLDWYPNQSALQHFKTEIWPGLRQALPGVRFEIAGRFPPGWMKQWAQSDQQVTLTANPKDIRPCIDRAAVFVCPITDGGGTRLKLLDAMAMGKAIVTTRIGCEGLRVTPGRELLVADTPANFGAAVLQLLTDDELRENLKRAAREFVVREYSWSTIGEQLEAAYGCAAGGSCRDHSGGRTEAVAPVPATTG